MSAMLWPNDFQVYGKCLTEAFILFVDALLAENRNFPGLDEMSAGPIMSCDLTNLVEFCRKHDMNLFHPFSDAEFKEILCCG